MPQGWRLPLETVNVALDEAEARSYVGVPPRRYVRLAVHHTGVGMDMATETHFIADRSEDDTGPILDRIAAVDRCLTVIHGESCHRAGWAKRMPSPKATGSPAGTGCSSLIPTPSNPLAAVRDDGRLAP